MTMMNSSCSLSSSTSNDSEGDVQIPISRNCVSYEKCWDGTIARVAVEVHSDTLVPGSVYVPYRDYGPYIY